MTSTQPQCNFLQMLPPELRDIIYRFAIVGERTNASTSTSLSGIAFTLGQGIHHDTLREPTVCALARTCHAIKSELELIYTRVRCTLRLPEPSPPTADQPSQKFSWPVESRTPILSLTPRYVSYHHLAHLQIDYPAPSFHPLWYFSLTPSARPLCDSASLRFGSEMALLAQTVSTHPSLHVRVCITDFDGLYKTGTHPVSRFPDRVPEKVHTHSLFGVLVVLEEEAAKGVFGDRLGVWVRVGGESGEVRILPDGDVGVGREVSKVRCEGEYTYHVTRSKWLRGMVRLVGSLLGNEDEGWRDECDVCWDEKAYEALG